MKMLVVFEKMGINRFIGHLDLQRAMQRALRRSGLPVCYSQGFNPHLLLSFASPLSVGVQGENEVMELPLAAEISETEFLEKLNRSLPEGLKAKKAKLLEDEVAPAMARLAAAVYRITPCEGAQALFDAVPKFLKLESLPYTKKTKTRERTDDFRPLLYNLTVKGDDMIAVLAVKESGTGKPEQLMSLLCDFAGLPLPRCLVTRTALLDERFKPLEEP